MTIMGLDYLKYKETARSNLASEAETHRANVANETEKKRSNLANEAETNRSNLAREAETNRSNLAREAETHRANLKNEELKGTELQIKRDEADEKVRANKAKEQLTQTDIIAKHLPKKVAEMGAMMYAKETDPIVKQKMIEVSEMVDKTRGTISDKFLEGLAINAKWNHDRLRRLENFFNAIGIKVNKSKFK